VLPIIISPSAVRVGLFGGGDPFVARRRMLEAAGAEPKIFAAGAPPDAAECRLLDILFVAGLGESASREIYNAAHLAGVLVNVEDVPKLCDFHVPAQVRRGDLLLTVSTGGRSPALSSLIRESLEELFGAEWEIRLEQIAVARARWRSAGLAPKEIAERTRQAFVTNDWSITGQTK